jgi:hypothetical protein
MCQKHPPKKSASLSNVGVLPALWQIWSMTVEMMMLFGDECRGAGAELRGVPRGGGDRGFRGRNRGKSGDEKSKDSLVRPLPRWPAYFCRGIKSVAKHPVVISSVPD